MRIKTALFGSGARLREVDEHGLGISTRDLALNTRAAAGGALLNPLKHQVGIIVAEALKPGLSTGTQNFTNTRVILQQRY